MLSRSPPHSWSVSRTLPSRQKKGESEQPQTKHLQTLTWGRPLVLPAGSQVAPVKLLGPSLCSSVPPLKWERTAGGPETC